MFIDGIAFDDPAAANEPRFESFSADGIGRIEVIRGPQSALWGSEALGGVIALQSPDPLRGERLEATGEYGSRDSARAAFAGTLGTRRSWRHARGARLKTAGSALTRFPSDRAFGPDDRQRGDRRAARDFSRGRYSV